MICFLVFSFLVFFFLIFLLILDLCKLLTSVNKKHAKIMSQPHLLDFFLQCCSQGSEVVGGFLQLTDLDHTKLCGLFPNLLS